MYRLTRKQRNARHQIEGWQKGKFNLEPDWVRENYLPGGDPAILGEYHTPSEMALVAANMTFIEPGAKILDPCAGIGNLLHPFVGGNYHLEGYELSYEAIRIAKKLYPDLSLHHADVFDRVDEIEGKFDYVIMNPPFGVKSGLETALEASHSGAKLSQPLFLELAIRALKYGGRAVVIAPYNLMTKISKGAEPWFEENMNQLGVKSQLPGDFLMTKVQVDGFLFERISHPTPDPVVPVVKPDPVVPVVKIDYPQETFLQGEQLKLF